MLNIKLLGGVRVPFYAIIFCFVIAQSNWLWEVREKNRGVKVL